MQRIGKLLVIEGPDGVGKTTLAQLLASHLMTIGVACEYFSFPGRETGTLGYHVYEIHHHPERFGLKDMSDVSLQLLHVAAHVDAIERRVIPTLNTGRCVVLDRFWWSTWVYGIVSGIEAGSLKSMLDVELSHWHTIRPSRVFLIRRNTPLRQNVKTEVWQKFSCAYDRLAEEEALHYPISVIDNNGALEGAIRTVIHVIEQLGLKKTAAHSSKQQQGSSPRVREAEQLRLGFLTGRSATPQNQHAFNVITSVSPAKPTIVYETYWRFAAERQAIFFRRLQGFPSPWTDDPILQEYKFTNAYRASDRVSQYLIRNVIYRGDQAPQEVFFRTMVFKIFNRISTWELLERQFGSVSYAEYSFDRYDKVLSKALNYHERIYSAAYIMPSGHSAFGYSAKHRNHLRLIEKLMENEAPVRLMEKRTMLEAFEFLRSFPMLGDFLAYQYVTDINYSMITDFSEMEFVVPGPGAKDGISKCFTSLGGLSESDVIRLVADSQEKEFARLGIAFQSLWGRRLQLIDCQNLFCEVAKYSRLAHPDFKGCTDRARIKQHYRQHAKPIEYWYPPKWSINVVIENAQAVRGNERY